MPFAISESAISACCYVVSGLSQIVLGASASLFTSLILLAVAIALELIALSVIRAKFAARKR